MISLMLIKKNDSKGEFAKAIDSIPDQIPANELLWANVENPKKEEIETLKRRFGLDDYSIEDVTSRKQRPKIEEYKTYNFSVLHVPVLKDKKSSVAELFIFFEKNWIISISYADSEVIASVQNRINTRGVAPFTTNPMAEHLFYMFLDFAVDAFYPLLDEAENQIESLDSRAVSSFKQRSKKFDVVINAMSTIGGMRNRLMILRRSIVPTRDLLGQIMRGTVPFIASDDLNNFRDIYDHSFQLLESIDAYRIKTGDVRELYISLLTVTTDNIIKLLTIVATIFLPLTLLAGIYGMNFTPGFYTPGSGTVTGFYILISAMIAIGLTSLYLFRRAGWI